MRFADRYCAVYRRRGRCCLAARRGAQTPSRSIKLQAPRGGMLLGPILPSTSGKSTMDTWSGSPSSPVPPPLVRSHSFFGLINLTVTPQECIHCWDEFNVHPPASNPTRLVSNGHGFIEIPWYPQYTFINAGPTPPGPLPPPRVSPPPDLPPQQVDPLGQSTIATGIQEVATNEPSRQLSTHRLPSRPPRAPRARPRRSPAPHTTRMAPRLSSMSPTMATRMSSPSLSEEEARGILETWIRNSDWYNQNEMEPVVGGPGVPTCALQLASKGQSIYCCFLIPVLDRKGKISGWKSATDPASKPDRHQRALGRERANRDHCPFQCPRYRGHNPDWSVRFLLVTDPVLTLNSQ